MPSLEAAAAAAAEERRLGDLASPPAPRPSFLVIVRELQVGAVELFTEFVTCVTATFRILFKLKRPEKFLHVVNRASYPYFTAQRCIPCIYAQDIQWTLHRSEHLEHETQRLAILETK